MVALTNGMDFVGSKGAQTQLSMVEGAWTVDSPIGAKAILGAVCMAISKVVSTALANCTVSDKT
jgi:hypothetical protein